MSREHRRTVQGIWRFRLMSHRIPAMVARLVAAAVDSSAMTEQEAIWIARRAVILGPGRVFFPRTEHWTRHPVEHENNDFDGIGDIDPARPDSGRAAVLQAQPTRADQRSATPSGDPGTAQRGPATAGHHTPGTRAGNGPFPDGATDSAGPHPPTTTGPIT